MLLPGDADAYPDGILSADLTDDKGFITDWIKPFAPDLATQAGRDKCIKQARDLLGADASERERTAFMAGVSALAHWLVADATMSLNEGYYVVPISSVIHRPEVRTSALLSTLWDASSEPPPPDMTAFEEMLTDEC